MKVSFEQADCQNTNHSIVSYLVMQELDILSLSCLRRSEHPPYLSLVVWGGMGSEMDRESGMSGRYLVIKTNEQTNRVLRLAFEMPGGKK